MMPLRKSYYYHGDAMGGAFLGCTFSAQGGACIEQLMRNQPHVAESRCESPCILNQLQNTIKYVMHFHSRPFPMEIDVVPLIFLPVRTEAAQ